MFLIVTGGDTPGKEFLKARAEHARMVIAADRGAEYCLEAGVMPDIVVGDMDSISPRAIEELNLHGVRQVKYSTDKDKTDTQLALEVAMQHGASNVEMLAASGDRFDHTLANVHLLVYAIRSGIDACILSPTQRIVIIDSDCTISGMKGSTISLLPLTLKAEGIYLSGFQYDLEDASMEIDFPRGISNVVISDDASIKVENGILIAIISGSYL